MNELLPGWALTTVGEIAETRLGKMLSAKARSGNGGRPYLRNKNVQWGRIDTDDLLTMDFSDDEFEKFRLRAGDLLVCEGGEVGRAAIWREPIAECAYQKALHRVRPRGGVAPEYLLYLLMHYSGAHVFERYITGSTIAHLPQEDLRELPVPLAPLAEQRRIVAALEEQLSRLDATSAALSAADRRLDTLRGAILDRLTQLEGETRLTGEVAEVQGGIQKQPKRRPVRNRFPFLRVANVQRGELDLSELHEVELFDGELERFALRRGDLLVVEGNGSPEQIGRSAMWNSEIPNCVHQNHLIRVRPGPLLEPAFLDLYWNAPSTARRLTAVASSTSGLYTLSTAKVKAVPVLVPTLDEQRRAVAESLEQLSRVAQLRQAVRGASSRATALRRSILASAFRGELVQQDANDEPASVLLERIAAERAAAPKLTRRRRATMGER